MNVLKPRTFAKLCSVFLTFFAFALTINAAPARRGPVVMTQPDGSTFIAQLRGDEFMKIKTTADGCAIIQGEDGWWYYGIYDAQGLTSSGIKVGGKAPSESRNIPYARIAESARQQRTAVVRNGESLLKSVMRRHGVATKAASGATSPIEKHGIIILAQFSDVPFKYTKDDFETLLKKKKGSAMEYFNEQLKGTYNFNFDVSDIVTLPQKRSYYGKNKDNIRGNDQNPAQMVVHACEALDSKIDFSQYDDDGDGYVDNVFIFFAGEDEAEGAASECLWSHAWYVWRGAGKNCVLDGVRIDSYACTAELTNKTQLAGIGTFCHEYTHTFGTADMYDTDYDNSGKQAAALWMNTNIMDGGNSNDNGNTPPNYSSIQYDELGTFQPTLIDRDGTYTLEPISKNGQYYRINCDDDGEYYLLECRKASGWDSFIGGSGMLIYHIDKSTREVNQSANYPYEMETAAAKWTEYNEVNAYAAHQCADLVEANGTTDQFSSTKAFYNAFYSLNTASLFFPYMSTNSYRLKNWSGKAHPITVKDIKKVGDNIEFTIEGTGSSVAVPEVKSPRIDTFQYEALITFSSSLSVEGAEAYIAYKRAGTGSYSEKIKVEPYATGKYAYRLKGLEADNVSYNLQIWFENGDAQSKTTQLSFMTFRTGEYPFIHLSCQTTAVSRNDDGTFKSGAQLPLVVYNVEKDSETEWFFDDKAVDPGKACFYSVTKSGELKAVVHNADGSSEVLVKHITVR